MIGEQILEKYKECNMQKYFAEYGEIEQKLEEMALELQKLSELEQDGVLQKFENQSRNCPEWMRIHMLSFCMQVSMQKERKKEYAYMLLKVVNNASYDVVGEYNKLSHFWQASTVIFMDKDLECGKIQEELVILYRTLFLEFYNILKSSISCIPFEQRNEKLVIVMASQVLGMKHAPTKTLLDRCYVLQRYLGKKVSIINTAMQMTGKGAAPFFRMRSAAYDDKLYECNYLEFNGEKFEFYQCKNNMPDIEQICLLLKMMKDKKPAYILNIGGSDICSDLCGEIVPEITISTVFSKISYSCGMYQITDKELSEEDVRQLQILNVEPKNVKRTRFTFSFTQQQRKYARKELGIYDDAFVLVVVGWRLDTEINKDFLNMLEYVLECNDKISIVFLGQFNTCKERIKDYSCLKSRYVNLGMRDDVLGILECCDLYVNPRRNGGGSSIAEALYKRIPAVTLPVGDASVAAGEKFWVDNYEKMAEKILQYAKDATVYLQMADEAEKRATLLLDSKAAFSEVMKDIEKELEEI